MSRDEDEARQHSQDPRYAAWIAANVEGTGYGKCAEVTEAMAKAFPELRRVRGHHFCYVWGRRSHWWCETKDGEIVDPTAAQFPSGGIGDYVEFTGEDEDLPTGVCADCGGETFDHAMFCSDACEASYRTYLETGEL